MALVINDRVKETSTTTGTGAFNLDGASQDFESFASGVGASNTTFYSIVNTGTGEFEVGTGTVNASVTFTVTGTDIAGNALSEAITGPESTTVTGSKFFNTVTQIATSGTVGTNTSVGNAAGTTGGQAVLTAGRTRVRGMHITTGGTVGNISYFNTSPVTGTSLFSFQVATTTKDYIDPYIPDDGVLFNAGAFIDIPAGTAVSVTTFFDG